MSKVNKRVEAAIDQLVSSTRWAAFQEVSIALIKMREDTVMAGEHLAYLRAIVMLEGLKMREEDKETK